MKMKGQYHPIYALLTLFIFITSCNGQEKTKSGEENQLKIDLLAPGQGVQKDTSTQISEYVVEVFEDKKGNLWFGTMSDGAIRYDGKSLTYFSTRDGLCDNTVASIAEDHEGNMWFGTHNGASRYDGKTFTSFGSNDGLPGNGCNILVDRKGNIWAGTNSGAFRFNGFAFLAFDLPDPDTGDQSYKWVRGKVWSLLEDKKGNLWFGGSGVSKYDGKSFTHFTKKKD